MFLSTYAEKTLTIVRPANLFHVISTLCAYTRTHTHRLARWVSVCTGTEIVGVFLMLSESLKCCWPICERNDHGAVYVCGGARAYTRVHALVCA